jgi:secretion/DNA translocation related TadE-like protein
VIRREDGSATIWVLALSMILVLVGTAAVVIAIGFAVHRRTAAAADLAALAGASTSLTDTRAACLAADVTARANGAALVACRLSGSSLIVVAQIDAPTRWLPAIEVAARAGP